MTLEVWTAFCITELILCFTPGPAVLLVVSTSLGRDARAGIGAAFGILVTNAFYFALSATGVAAVLIASREVFLALKWLGATYLVWTGIRMLLAPAASGSARPIAISRAFLHGFLVQGANPKALVFFVALLPQFVDVRAPLAGQLVVLGASSVAIEFLALSFYVAASVRTGGLAGPFARRLLERLGGGLLVAAGARLATVRAE